MNAVAAIAATITLLGFAAVMVLAAEPAPHAGARSTSTTVEKVFSPDPSGAGEIVQEKVKTVSENAAPEDDRSFLGRVLNAPGGVLMFRLALLLLLCFLVGAVVQRVLLGKYGVTVGPLTLPEIVVPKEETQRALDLIKESPEVAPLALEGPRGLHPLPQFFFVEGDRPAFMSIRLELEEKIRKLAEAHGIERELDLNKLLSRLKTHDVLDTAAEAGLRQLLELGDRALEGASVDREAAQALRDQALRILYALDELIRRASEEAPSETPADPEIATVRVNVSGSWIDLEADSSGRPRAYWSEGSPQLPDGIEDKVVRDASGRVLHVKQVVASPQGPVMIAVPAAEDLQPLMTVSAFVTQEGHVLTDAPPPPDP